MPPWWLEAEILHSEYDRNRQHIGREKIRLGTCPHLTDKLNIKNVATCDNLGMRCIAVDDSYRQCMLVGLVSRKQGKTNSEMISIDRRINTDRAEILAVLMVIARSEVNNKSVVKRTDRRAIAERYNQ